MPAAGRLHSRQGHISALAAGVGVSEWAREAQREPERGGPRESGRERARCCLQRTGHLDGSQTPDPMGGVDAVLWTGQQKSLRHVQAERPDSSWARVRV